MNKEIIKSGTVVCNDTGKFTILSHTTRNKDGFYICDYEARINPDYNQKNMLVREKDINNLLKFKPI